MRSWREPKEINLEYYSSFDVVMDLLVRNGNFIQEYDDWGTFYTIKVVGQDKYYNAHLGKTPSEAVRAALRDYNKFKQDKLDTAQMLEEWRQQKRYTPPQTPHNVMNRTV